MIPFSCLNRDIEELDEISKHLDLFIRKGKYILGDILLSFEKSFAEFTGHRYAVGTGNATDALYLIFRVLNLKRIGICAASPLPCGQAIKMADAEMVLFDAENEGGLLDIKKFKEDKRKIDSLLAVHLYGQAERTDELKKICEEKKISLIEDCSQSVGTYIGGKHTGKFSILSAFSFYPTKNLGGFGDGGMIMTDDKDMYDKLVKMRNYGQISVYSAQTEGINSRLDDIQAVILLVKMKSIIRKNERRRAILERYKNEIENKKILLPPKRYFETSNGHLMPIFTENREILKEHLLKMNVSTAVHYPHPLHKQEYFKQDVSLPVSESLSQRELTIPSFSELTDEEVSQIIKALNSYE
ncbi:MAG: DegT/DnrJ/EryC1/StrS family aminotransferase [bacterium]